MSLMKARIPVMKFYVWLNNMAAGPQGSTEARLASLKQEHGSLLTEYVPVLHDPVIKVAKKQRKEEEAALAAAETATGSIDEPDVELTDDDEGESMEEDEKLTETPVSVPKPRKKALPKKRPRPQVKKKPVTSASGKPATAIRKKPVKQ